MNTLPPPLREDAAGALRVGDSRMLLELEGELLHLWVRVGSGNLEGTHRQQEAGFRRSVQRPLFPKTPRVGDLVP